MKINGLTVIDNYIDAKTHDDLIVNINNSYWSKSLSGYIQHYGYVYNYNFLIKIMTNVLLIDIYQVRELTLI
jgi:hypothetical protein